MVEIITKGAHWRNVKLAKTDEPRQFAHLFDADEPEDVPHQAQNFIQYANALGNFVAPHILIGPPEQAVHLCDWSQIVESATGVRVETR